MTVTHHRLHRIWIALSAPTRDKEGLLNAVVPVSIENARHGDVGPITQHRGCRDHAVCFLWMGQIEDALGIHVERETDGAARAVGPRHRVANHSELISRT